MKQFPKVTVTCNTPMKKSTAFRNVGYLTIIPGARIGSESIAHEAEWAIESEAGGRKE